MSEIIAPEHIRRELSEAELDACSIQGLFEHIIDPTFACYTCEGILDAMSQHTGGDKNAAAREWMEENYSVLFAACCAAGSLVERVTDILQGLPVPKEGVEG